MSAPSCPALSASWRVGSSIARRTICTPTASSPSSPLILSSAFCARMNATPPPGTMPYSTLNVVLLAFALDNGGIFLVDGNALGFAKLIELHVLELDPEIFRDATT